MASSLTWQARIVAYTVHDGDTLTNVTIDQGWYVQRIHQSIRLTSSQGPVNAPEVTGREAAAGLLVRDWVRDWLAMPGQLWLRSRSIDHDSRGRTVGDVLRDEAELGLVLLLRGLAKRCKADGTRIPFTDDELQRIVAQLGAKA